MAFQEIKEHVRKRYSEFARKQTSCCGPQTSCCGGSNTAEEISSHIGYSAEEMKAVPEGANLGLGCGNPVALAALKEGHTVLDLGSGAGFDCFLAARQVGPEGRVIGVDMTADMVDKARKNAEKGGLDNVEFRLGEIEHLPVEADTVDVIISNCVINLVPDKAQAFRETLRVLKPGGRLMISDLVLNGELPAPLQASLEAYVGCIAGASQKNDYLGLMEEAGFTEVEILQESTYPVEFAANDPLVRNVIEETGLSASELLEAAKVVTSVKVSARKPS